MSQKQPDLALRSRRQQTADEMATLPPLKTDSGATMKTLTLKTRFALVLVGLGFINSMMTQTAHADVKNYRRTLKATTWILAKNSEGTSSGTGVLIDTEKKLVVTNAHVVGDARNVVLFFADMKNDSPIVERSHYLQNVKKLGIRGRVLAVDRKRDLALVELGKLPEGVTAIALATESSSPGQDVESIGNPGSTDALWVFTSGTVRAVYQKKFRTGAGEHNFKVVETQSPINSGDSGGPVVNENGELVAISQAIATKARLVSYFVDISEIKAFLESPWKPAPLPVENVLKSADLEFTQHKTGHFEIEMTIAEKKNTGKKNTEEKKQTVFVGKEIEYYERADIRKIWSLAETLDAAPGLETTMKLLEQNARTKLGSWTIERTQNGKFLVVYCVKIDATASPDAVKSTMEYVAKLTNSMTGQLTPKAKVQDANDTLADWLEN